MSDDPKCWRDLRARLRDLGARPVRTKGSHEMWKLPDGEMFLVVRNHLARRVPSQVLARYRRLRSRREPDEGSPSIPWTIRATVARSRFRALEATMAKSKSKSSNNQRSNVKNPNNKAYRADRANRIAHGHPNPPPPPPAATKQDR